MSESSIIYPATEWNANDYANIITISAAAISSVLLVIFKSRCKKIDLCCGAVNCLRDPMEEDEEAAKELARLSEGSQAWSGSNRNSSREFIELMYKIFGVKDEKFRNKLRQLVQTLAQTSG